jgi:hypothetical protein
MGLFADSSNQQREFNTRVNDSCYGKPVSVVMGAAQVEQQIYWIDGFQSSQLSSKGGGGGKGGGKGGEYVYSADVVVGLCNGPILGIGNVWAGQSWLTSPTANESFTIGTGGVFTFTPSQATNLTNDLVVGVSNTFSASLNDIGAPSPTVLSGSDLAPMTKVSFGTTLTTGTYSINPTGNVYNFSTADSGRTVQVSYTFNITNETLDETDIVPSGLSLSVSGTGTGSKVNADYGVRYAAPPNEGTAFTKVSGTPSVTGTYSVSGNNPAVYKFASGDLNALVTITFGVNDPNVVPSGETQSLNYTLNSGTQGQSPYSFLTSDFPGAAFGYTNIATLLYQPMDLGLGAQIQENRFEVITSDIYGGGILDCNPVQCIGEVLTNSVWGLGAGPIPFPVSCIDNGSSGTWGRASSFGARQSGATAWNWFAAQSFFISPVIDGQDTAASEVSKWLEAGMCAAFISEGLLKLVPYGDTSAAGNGSTWTAPSEYVAALDDTIFLPGDSGAEPVKISRVSTHDAWNVVQVQWDNRLNQYAPEITQESDQGLINRWGERREDPQDWDFIHTVQAATFAANLRIKHNGYIRNSYEFGLPYGYSYIEPMDIVTITTSSVWAAGLNNLNLSIVTLPVRVLKVVDDPIKGLQLTCEDYPFGAHAPTLYNKQLAQAEVQPNIFADPGNTEAVMFQASNRLSLQEGDQIWIGALGTSDAWGFCNICVAQSSGGDYQPIGTIKLPARIGELETTFASGSDPDTVNSMIVNLVENCGPFEAGSTTDADSGNTLCFVDNEIIAYSALTYTGQNQITMGTYIRRGQMGTTISSHSTGGLFMRLDNSIFKYTYDPVFRGQTLYFKFQSVNSFGNMAQPLSSLTPVSFTIPNSNLGSVDKSTGLVIALGNPSSQNIIVNNSNFEASTALPIPNWNPSAATLSYDTSTPFAGSQSLIVTASATDGGAKSAQSWAIKPGQQFLVSAAMKSDGTGSADAELIFLNAAGSQIGQIAAIGGTATSWNAVSATGVAPANTVSGYLALLNLTSGGSGIVEFDDISLQAMLISSTILTPQGSVAGISDYTFSYTSTTTAITWSWGAFDVLFPDGTTYTVAASTGSAVTHSNPTSGTVQKGTAPIEYTGLTASTTYNFCPFVTLNPNGTASVSILWGSTTAGFPTLAQQIQIVNGDGNVPVAATVDVTAATTASGGGGGTGGGPGGGGTGRSCFSPNTKVKTQRGDVAIVDLVVGEDMVLTARGTWKLVLGVTVRNWDGIMLNMGEDELVTVSHLFLNGALWQYASEVHPDYPVVFYEGTIHNVHVNCDEFDDDTLPDTEHSYTLSNGSVVHNVTTLEG